MPHETSADRGRRDRLAFERIRMQAGALFAADHAPAEVPTSAPRRRTLLQPVRDHRLRPRWHTADEPIGNALARAVKAPTSGQPRASSGSTWHRRSQERRP
jgi:hypothetical protein